MRRILITGIATVVVLGLIRLSVFTVPAGQLAVVTRFGRPVATITEPGLQWKLPGFLARVNRLDGRIVVLNTQPIQLLLGDKNPIILTTYVAWRIGEPLTYFRSLVTRQTARQKLGDMVVSALGAALADYTLEDIINTDPEAVRLAELEARVGEVTRRQAEAKYGIDVVRVGIRRIAYPSIVAEAVYNRMRAERDKEARRHRAEGTEAAARIEAATDTEVASILAEAYREAEILKGEGDREAARIYAEAYGRDREFFEFLRSLDLYRKTIRDGTTLILSTDSELFRHLESPEGGRGRPD
jgi:membrane protease subunit HflC